MACHMLFPPPKRPNAGAVGVARQGCSRRRGARAHAALGPGTDRARQRTAAFGTHPLGQCVGTEPLHLKVHLLCHKSRGVETKGCWGSCDNTCRVLSCPNNISPSAPPTSAPQGHFSSPVARHLACFFAGERYLCLNYKRSRLVSTIHPGPTVGTGFSAASASTAPPESVVDGQVCSRRSTQQSKTTTTTQLVEKIALSAKGSLLNVWPSGGMLHLTVVGNIGG